MKKYIEEEYKAEVKKYKVENFVEDGKHFSHDHPLRLMSGDDKDDDDKYKSLCSLCGVPILSAPSYTCTLGCKFFLHKPCADLPPKLIHAHHSRPPTKFDSDQHILYIITKKSSSSYHHYYYQCEDCEFSLHPLVAISPHLEIRTSHMSHASHSLVLICRRISCECDACGRKHELGFFFHCRDCDFWIHQDCTILPNALQFPPHRDPFILVYSMPSFSSRVFHGCIFCYKTRLVRRHGIYFCPQLSRYAHAACGSTHQFASQAKLNTIQLPDDEWDMNTFPISVLRRYAEINPPVNVDVAKLTIKEYHKHSLVLTEEDSSSRSELELARSCDLCTRSIPIHSSSSFHKCETCDFAAHKLCADILPLLEYSSPNWIPRRGKHYRDPSETFFNSIFYCFICRRPCNGVSYYFPYAIQELFVDLECMAAPTTINHASHEQGHHLLFRSHRFTGETPHHCCPHKLSMYDVYKCTVCDYFIHTSCAMLPMRIVCNEYDEHPLHLAFTAPPPTSNYSFCEVCEEDMDYTHWFYECGECDKSFHINCIPSLGYLSKVKFGGTLRLPDSHAHPLALTRMLTVPSQRCGSCSKIIRGMLDEMAFFCSRCHFWLHFSCASDLAAISNAARPLKLYWESRKEIEVIRSLN